MKRKAFTLIELLVSVSIFAAIGVVLYSCFRAGVVSYKRISTEGEFQKRARYALDTITRDIKNMAYVSSIPFEGQEQDLSFMTIRESSDGINKQLVRVSYYIEKRDNKEMLIRAEKSFKEALIEATGEAEGASSESEKNQTVILEGVPEFTLNYLRAEENEEEEIEYDWLSIWEDDDLVPVGIRLEISLSNPEGEGTIPLSKRIFVPTAKPLIE